MECCIFRINTIIRRSGGDDFFGYYKIYLHPLDLSATDPPLVFRQLSAIVTHLIYRAGIYYPDAIWFHEEGYDQHVFFAALLTNYVCLVFCAWVVGFVVQHQLATQSFVPATFAGLICLFSFHSQVSVVTGDTEGLSWLLTAVAFLMFIRRQVVPLAVALALAIVQRELILVLFSVIAGFFLLSQKDKQFNGFVLVWSLACFSAHVAMRKFAVHLPDTTGQLDPNILITTLRDFHLTRGFIFQAIISQNLLWIYITSALLLGWKTQKWSIWLPILIGSFLVIGIVAIAAADAVEATNLGRYGSLLSPILAAGITASIFQLDTRVTIS